MIWPPSLMRLRIEDSRHKLGLWLPLFLIWPLLLVIGLVLLPIVLVLTVVAIVLWPRWWRPLILGVPLLFVVICAVRGLEVDIQQPSQKVRVYFK